MKYRYSFLIEAEATDEVFARNKGRMYLEFLGEARDRIARSAFVSAGKEPDVIVWESLTKRDADELPMFAPSQEPLKA